MSAKLPADILIETVVEKGLCTRCGTCVGACPSGNLRIADPLGACLPVATGECRACGMCLACCPGAVVDFEPLERRLFGEATAAPLLGVVRRSYLAHAADPEIRKKGSSGGVATALLVDCLARGETKGALLFAPHDREPWRGWGTFASDRASIIEAAQSRYQLSPLNAVLSRLSESKETFAYVGLSCQVHGLRKLEAAGWEHAGRLSPVIGLYCGNNLYFEATRVMLKKLGVRRLSDVVSLSYREGTWPGSFVVRTRGGGVRAVSKFDFNQVIPFYVNRRCLFCIDLTNELSDLSIGDGWAKERDGGDGWAVVLVRTETGERIMNRAMVSGVIVAEPVERGRVERMHSHGFDLKKTGSFLRLGLWRRWGCPVPRYDRRPPTVTRARRLLELFVSLQFAFSSSPAGRSLFRILPIGPMGRLFRLLRTGWMRYTSAR
jgi:coenzyme F420 hydrogenase subunit beta